MFTGLYAFNHGMGTNCDMYHALASELPDPSQLLHTRLQEAGYRCGYTGKWHIGTNLGPADYGFEGMSIPGYGDLRQDSGFQQYLKDNDISYGPIKNPIYANHDQQTLIAGEWNGPLQSTPTYYLTNFTLNLLDEFAHSYREDDQPFFLTCQYWAPHGPNLPSPEYVGRHDRESIPAPGNYPDDYHGKPRRLSRIVNSFFQALPISWEAWQQVAGLSYDYTTLVDEQIGRLLTHLDKLGLADSTIVVFTSDHGDMMGSHGLQDKGFMYEEAHRVPLLIHVPGEDGGFESDELVYNMDIMPTLFELIDLELDAEIDARSLASILNPGESPEDGRDALILEFHGIRYLHTQRGLVTGDGYKYIFNPVDEDELYDLNADPSEMNNLLIDKDHPKADDLRRQLIALARAYGDPVQDCIAKWFGQWNNYSGQPDVSSQYTTANSRD